MVSSNTMPRHSWGRGSKVYGQKFAGDNKSGQLSILVLVQNTDEGKISTIPLTCSSTEAWCAAWLLRPHSLMLHLCLKGFQLLILSVCLQGIRFWLELEPDWQGFQELWPRANLVLSGEKSLSEWLFPSLEDKQPVKATQEANWALSKFYVQECPVPFALSNPFLCQDA